MCHHVPKCPGLFPQCSFTTIKSFRLPTVDWFFRSFGLILRALIDIGCHSRRRSWRKFTREELLEAVVGVPKDFVIIGDGRLVRLFHVLDFVLRTQFQLPTFETFEQVRWWACRSRQRSSMKTESLLQRVPGHLWMVNMEHNLSLQVWFWFHHVS